MTHFQGATDSTPEDLQVDALLARFNVSDYDLTLLNACGQALGAEAITRVLDRFYDWLSTQPEFDTFFSL